ncbi:MAG: OsmC family protein [Actinomycetota bacterium]|nr:OsmC family protein [Actinomycetota bacterium]
MTGSPPPKTLSVQAAWQGGYRCEVTTRQHRIQVDEPASAGGTDSGPGPTELLLASLASCFTLAVFHVASKRGIDLRAVDVTVTGTYAGPSFSDLALDVAVDAAEDRIDELLERAKALCYVSNTLVRGPTLTVRRAPNSPGA